MKRWGIDEIITNEAEYAFSKNINVGNLKTQTLDTALTMHANKEDIGQYSTHVKILRNKIMRLREKIKLLQRDDYLSEQLNFEAYKQVVKNDGTIWSTITKYHRFHYMPAEFQMKNEPSTSKPHYMSKIINGLYEMDPEKYGHIWDKSLALKKIYEKKNARERLRITEYRLRTSEHHLSSIGRMLTRETSDPAKMHESRSLEIGRPNETVIFVVPIKGRLDTFRRFITHWEDLASQDTKIGLVVTIFGTRSQIDEIETVIEELIVRYPRHTIEYQGMDEGTGGFAV